MDVYTIYADHKEGVNAHWFVSEMKKFLSKMEKNGAIESFRITRMKLGFRSMDLPEFRIDMEFKGLQQLDDAMTSVIHNDDNIEKEHKGFNHLVDVETIQHFLYRDFPDD
jgi:hypothetical protein